MRRTVKRMLLAGILAGAMTAGAVGAAAYADVPDSHWASAEIRYVTERGLFRGRTAETFAPSDSLTRGQLAAVLHRYAGEPEPEAPMLYGDVPEGMYYYNPIRWAAEQDIFDASHRTADRLDPDGTVTRAEFSVMLYRFHISQCGGAEATGTANSTAGFTDMDSATGEVREAVLGWAVPHGILRGTTATTMNPDGRLTRAHVAAMLYRYDTSGLATWSNPASGTADRENPSDYEIIMDVPEIMKPTDRRALSPVTRPMQERVQWEYTTSAPAVLAVERAGDGQTVLTAKSPGTATVTAVNTLDGRSVTRTVLVRNLDINARMETRLEIVRLVNQLRQEHGLNTLTINDALMKAAQAYAEKNPPDHDFTLSEPLCDAFGYHCVHTENLAWNFEGAADTVQGWIDSPGHYRTMLLEGYDEVGVGAAENGCYALFLGISDMPRG